MKLKALMLFCLGMAVILLGGCASQLITNPDFQQYGGLSAKDVSAPITSPYYEGAFIFFPSWFGELNSLWFRFGEGGRSYGGFDVSFYEANDFRSHIGEYIILMNSIRPVLIDCMAVDSAEASVNLAFEEIVRDDYLYMLTISDRYYFFRMVVHEGMDFGYLPFKSMNGKSMNLTAAPIGMLSACVTIRCTE